MPSNRHRQTDPDSPILRMPDALSSDGTPTSFSKETAQARLGSRSGESPDDSPFESPASIGSDALGEDWIEEEDLRELAAQLGDDANHLALCFPAPVPNNSELAPLASLPPKQPAEEATHIKSDRSTRAGWVRPNRQKLTLAMLSLMAALAFTLIYPPFMSTSDGPSIATLPEAANEHDVSLNHIENLQRSSSEVLIAERIDANLLPPNVASQSEPYSADHHSALTDHQEESSEGVERSNRGTHATIDELVDVDGTAEAFVNHQSRTTKQYPFLKGERFTTHSRLVYYANHAELEGLFDVIDKSPRETIRIGF